MAKRGGGASGYKTAEIDQMRGKVGLWFRFGVCVLEDGVDEGHGLLRAPRVARRHLQAGRVKGALNVALQVQWGVGKGGGEGEL